MAKSPCNVQLYLIEPKGPTVALAFYRLVEKKQHTLQNTVMALPDKFIVFLGRTFSGHNHDYLMLKQEVPPEVDCSSAKVTL